VHIINTTLAEFQNNFPRIQKFVDGGQSVFIKGDNKTYEFRASQAPACNSRPVNTVTACTRRR